MLANDIFDARALAADLEPSERHFWQMTLIRGFERSLLDLFTAGRLDGTTHTCLGQEANAVAVLNALDRERDTVWSNHRCHGHFLAYCGNAYRLYAEILGRRTGVCGGRGGSQHLAWNNFFSSGIQGGLVPLAVGTAHAERERGAVSVVFLGDGTMGEGVVYEGLNLAALWSAPVLFVVEDNGIAQTTPRARGVAGSIAERAAAFGIASASCSTTDADELAGIAAEATQTVRGGRPFWLHVETTRLGPHSKGDDTRPAHEIAALEARDCLGLQAARVAPARRDEIEGQVRELLDAALASALEDEPACA